MLGRLGVLQLDSVNVFERNHYVTIFARLGSYDKADLDRITFGAKSRFIEYWAHVAALIPVESWPLFRWRMSEFREKHAAEPGHWTHSNGPMLDWLRVELANKGPLPASKIEHDSNRRTGSWWGWSDVKLGLEYLFLWGEVTSAGRTRFERTYALTEQVIPVEIRETVVSRTDAIRELLLRSARAHGIGTAGDLADYFRILKSVAKPVLDELVAEGSLIAVTVPGWKDPAFLHPDARIPRRMLTSALLSPFDPVVWERDRALRLFNFHYRIEIYTPAPKRIYGYYTLPVLIDDKIVGRIDLKSDRQSGALRVQSAWREPDAPAGVEERIVPLLEAARAWQDLDTVEFAGVGDLSATLSAAWQSH
jgi:uncharacterized protein